MCITTLLLPLSLRAAGLNIEQLGFVASGYMGDGEKGTPYVEAQLHYRINPHSAPDCQKWTCTRGEVGWAAVAWQCPPGNFGSEPGKALPAGLTKITWFARGARGDEEVEFFVGGNTSPTLPHQSSLKRESTRISLTRDWKQYSMSLSGDLSAVMCIFGWSAVAATEPLVFFLDDISLEESGLPLQARRAGDIAELGFTSTGYMGDGQYAGQRWVKMDLDSKDKPKSAPACQRWTYTRGSEGWAAVAWQFPPNNWGDQPGKVLAKHGFTKMVFRVRGTTGQEQVTFFSGGQTSPGKPHQASYAKVNRLVNLSTEWQEVTIPLEKRNMTCVVSAFGWLANQSVEFFLDDIRFE